jgi:hypothetical protein
VGVQAGHAQERGDPCVGHHHAAADLAAAVVPVQVASVVQGRQVRQEDSFFLACRWMD